MIAWVFPGQGSQFLGMGAGLSSEIARDTFATANEILGWNVREVCVGRSDELLGATEVSQPAILTVSVAVARALRAAGALPDAVAGHSVGEFAALVAAHAISFEDALRVVAVRAHAMGQAGLERPGGMAAILGLALDEMEDVLSTIDGVIGVASINGPAQIVVSGERDAVDAASDAARRAGARRVIPLDVSVAAHSALMSSAAVELAAALERTTLRGPLVPFVSSVTGRIESDPAGIARLLCTALTAPVCWVDAVRSCQGLGVTAYWEIGPGRVLCGLVRGIDRGADVEAIGDDETIGRLTSPVTAGRLG